VKIKGRSLYLGAYGSDESREAYARIVADLLAGRTITPPAPSRQDNSTPVARITVGELVKQYRQHADAYYRKGERPTSEVASIRCALKYLLDAYVDLPADAFAVGDLRAVRQRMVDAGLSRGVCNQNTGRIVRMFRWAASVEIIPASVWVSLQTLPGLKAGRTDARETEPVQPVDDEIVNATLPQLNLVVRAMVELQRATGMRPNEVCQVRPCDIDRTGDVWKFTPAEHKTQHHGKRRVILIGPKGQAILRPYLLRPEEEYCFRPKRHISVPRAHKRYGVNSYRQAIERACDRAFPAPEGMGGEQLKAWRKQHRWTPNRLRHSFATQARAQYGLEAAQVLLGHSSAKVTEVYAERDVAKGIEVARAIG
jgi:integrase